MMSDFKIIVISATVITLLLFFLYKLCAYRKIIDDKNTQLIQFYLDTKFFSKTLIDNLFIANAEIFCSNFISNIQEYYNLEDIIVIDSIAMIEKENNTFLRSKIIKKIKNNDNRILDELTDNNLVNIKILDEYEVYFSKIESKTSEDGMIVCVEKVPTLLNKHEIISLENSINLLKSRLLYS